MRREEEKINKMNVSLKTCQVKGSVSESESESERCHEMMQEQNPSDVYLKITSFMKRINNIFHSLISVFSVFRKSF